MIEQDESGHEYAYQATSWTEHWVDREDHFGGYSLLRQGTLKGGEFVDLTSEHFSTYIDYLVSAMSWHNGRNTSALFLFRGTVGSRSGRYEVCIAVGIERLPLRSKHGRWIEGRPLWNFAWPLHRCKRVCYFDRAVGLKPFIGQHTGWLLSS